MDINRDKIRVAERPPISHKKTVMNGRYMEVKSLLMCRLCRYILQFVCAQVLDLLALKHDTHKLIMKQRDNYAI